MLAHSRPQAWYCLALLCVLYSLSFIDRYILALLAPEVSNDLSLTDTQMGVLLGLGFAALYSIAGFPIAHLVDRSHRVRIIAVAVIVWSLSTAGSAFAQGFLDLLLFRSGIAIGEAALAPAAISLIADLFQRERRSTPVALFSTVAAVMGTGALAVGGAALSVAHLLTPYFAMAPWRLTMIIIGLPGILVAILLLLTVREPERQRHPDDINTDDASFGAFLRELKTNAWAYAPYYVSVAALTSAIFGLTSWAPTLLVRVHGMDASDAGYLLGLIGIPAALVATAVWPRYANIMERRQPRRGIIKLFLLNSLVVGPAFILAPLGGTPILIACGIGLVKMVNSMGPLGALAVVTIGPANMRGRLMAIYTASASMIGLSVGAIAVPALATLWPDEDTAMVYGISTLGLICTVIMVVSLFICYRAVGNMDVRRGLRIETSAAHSDVKI